MSTVPTSRDRILRSGLELMSTAGLAGVTLGVLAERSRMSKSGLFAHFRSKEEVQVGLLNLAERTRDAQVVAPAAEAEAGVARLKALFDHWLGWPSSAGLAGGCPIAAATFELDDLDGPVRERLVEMETRWRAMLAGEVRRAIETGEFRPNVDTEQFAWELSATQLGHQVSLRLLRDAKADHRAERMFSILIRRALTPPAK